jgi:hypothetical protein
MEIDAITLWLNGTDSHTNIFAALANHYTNLWWFALTFQSQTHFEDFYFLIKMVENFPQLFVCLFSRVPEGRMTVVSSRSHASCRVWARTHRGAP